MSSLATLSLTRCGRRIATWEAELKSKTLTMLSTASIRTFSSSTSSSSSPSGGIAALCQRLDADLSAMRSAGTFKTETVMTSPQGPRVTVADGNRQVLNFCSNNYLGFSNHPRLVAAARKSLDEFGFGLSSVRFICGTQSPHEALEKRIAELHGAEAAILYPSCFDANAGLFEAILTSEDAIVSDELNHASIIDGVRLCKAARYRFKHASVDDLKEKLKEARAAGARHVLVATDGVFSMDGEIAPLLEIKQACDDAGAVLFVDECHATGVLGEFHFFRFRFRFRQRGREEKEKRREEDRRGEERREEKKIFCLKKNSLSLSRSTSDNFKNKKSKIKTGAQLRGTDENFNAHGRVWDIVNSTLGKALGGATGGYTAGPARVVDTLRQKARPYLFSNSVSPAVVAASHAALDLLTESAGELAASLQSNTKRFR